MTRLSRLVLFAVVLASALTVRASAQFVAGSVASAESSVGAAAASARVGTMPTGAAFSASLPVAPSFGSFAAPSLSAPAPLSAPALSAVSAAPAVSIAAAPAFAPSAKPAATDGPTPLQAPLKRGEIGDPRLGAGDQLVHDGPRGRVLVPLSSFEPADEPVDWRSSRAALDRRFDGAASRAENGDELPVSAAASASAPAPLAKASAPAAKTSISVPAVANAARRVLTSRAVKVAAGALLLLLLTPGLALAQTAAAPVFTAASAVSLLSAYHPLVSAAGAVAGAVYGMYAARSKTGEASSGEVFASILHYGVLGGAGVFVLMDLTQMAFVGVTAVGLKPLSAAVATAALGRTAFQGKFADPATTSADRIVGAFPAVAAALGISLGVVTALVAPPIAETLAMGAMSITGAAAALYATIFKVGRSPSEGPARMGKGFVLQALMTGLALAVHGPALFWFFAALGAAGFGLVLWTVGRELWSFVPGRDSAPPAPPASPK